MQTRVRVPIRIKPSVVSERTGAGSAGAPVVADAVPPVMDREAVTPMEPSVAPAPPEPTTVTAQPEPATPRPESEVQEAAKEEAAEEESLEVWRDRALRLQAEMENFRKRQQRLAEERIAADRERLLRAFLQVADDLERALNADGADAEDLRRGVDLTYRSLMQLLDQEGVKPIQAKGGAFDPAWHEAVGTISHQDADAEPDTVVEVVQSGYRLGDRLLRPARVIVAT